ncbi:hypothetical protein BDP27DRAFT_1374441 [Rhodocollybia butyracea]|uniref:Uncharacterized protein n=1 Tax=Rhodocollybia butyracea TaxID=206335 RepID=A0A9P5P5H9_9AGAR|nr:hypothetical protein BDP27DRAFT_1374441 [Rhodocollybia butyracea]
MHIFSNSTIGAIHTTITQEDPMFMCKDWRLRPATILSFLMLEQIKNEVDRVDWSWVGVGGVAMGGRNGLAWKGRMRWAVGCEGAGDCAEVWTGFRGCPIMGPQNKVDLSSELPPSIYIVSRYVTLARSKEWKGAVRVNECDM